MGEGTPGVKLSETQSTESKWGEHFEYGGHFKTPPEAQAPAKVRAEELACRRKVFHGKSARPELSPGSRITIEGHPSGDKKLLITSVEHSLVQSAFGTTDSILVPAWRLAEQWRSGCALLRPKAAAW